MKKIKILTTSPSLDLNDNVSGIANLTRLWVENNKEVDYTVFEAGKKDNEKYNYKWFIKQFSLLFQFYKKDRCKSINIIHINMPLERFAVIRDSCFALICYLIKKEYILHIRGGSYNNNRKTSIIPKFFIKLTLINATRIIVLGDNEKCFITEYYKINSDKIRSLPNCVKIPNYSCKELNNNSTLNILFLGRIDKNKGLKEVIEALSMLPSEMDFIFRIAGVGQDKDWFIQECKNKLKGKFIYHGIVSGEIKNDLIKDSHIFLLPSYYEGLPNALLEVMSYGVVPIVTPVGSILEVVRDKENGIIIPINNSSQIADAIKNLNYKHNLYLMLSKNAVNTIVENYSLIKYLISLNKIYRSIINTR